MKTLFSRSFRFFIAVSLISLGIAQTAYPQTPASIQIQLYAGLTITGAVEHVYSIQYTTNLAQTNGWLTLKDIRLPSSPYLWIDTNTPATGQRFYRVVPGNMVWIPPGVFTMGSPTNEALRGSDELEHTVTLTAGFFMGKYEVTQAEYLSVTSNNPSRFTSANGYTDDLNRPVEQVNWINATNYCAQLTQREQQEGLLPPGWAYRLPTEAEWEYACRAGTTTPFHFGPDLRSGMANFDGRHEYVGGIGTVANTNGIFLDHTTTVGIYQPNAFGLYDMHGNVQEWCKDTYGDYLSGSVTDPQGPLSGPYRVYRGGDWLKLAWTCRAADRRFDVPTTGSQLMGFRVVLAPSQP